LDASHVDSNDFETPSIHHDEGPFARALDCPEHTSDCEVCSDSDADVDDLSEGDFGDLDGSESPQNQDYSVDPDESHIDASKVTAPDDAPNIVASRTYRPAAAPARAAQVRPWHSSAGPVMFAPSGPEILNR
jgi:hypothetical protein